MGPYEFTHLKADGLRGKCGLFVLYDETNCLLAGHTDNLGERIARLLEHPTECLQEYRPTFFEVSFVHPGEIASRFAALLQDLGRLRKLPLCGVVES